MLAATGLRHRGPGHMVHQLVQRVVQTLEVGKVAQLRCIACGSTDCTAEQCSEFPAAIPKDEQRVSAYFKGMRCCICGGPHDGGEQCPFREEYSTTALDELKKKV